MLDRPPRTSRTIMPASSPSAFDGDRLLVIAVAILLIQNNASWPLILALLYIAM